jgi:hypothetical protein
MRVSETKLCALRCGLALALMAFSLFQPTAAQAQVLYGSLVGTVTDPSGAVVPGAEVVATDTQTGQNRTDKTDSGGRFNLVNILPGTYTVKVSSAGFRPTEQTGFIITANNVARMDVHLEVGQTSDTVTVSADALQLQTDKGSTQTEITGKEVTELPLGGYRTYQTLVNLVPGAMPGAFANSTTDAPDRSLATHINGGNAQTNVTRIDGAISINAWLPNHVGYNVPAETVETVNVTSSAASADQGLAGSSAITLITKSGTNQLHGSAFEIDGNQTFNARNFFQKAGVAKPVSIYNNYGATLGGPIVKNKLFYFVSLDATAQKQNVNGYYTVPTDDQRAGNFSAYPSVIYNPYTGNPDGTGRAAFAGNMIGASYLSPAALKAQAYYPEPNLPGATNNYFAVEPSILNRYYFDTKINWNRNDKHTIWGKYGFMRATSGGTGILGAAGGPDPDGNAGSGLGHTFVQVGTIGHTYAFSPTVVLDGTIAYQRIKLEVNPQGYGTNYSSILGIPGINGPDPLQSGFPNFNIGAYAAFGTPDWMPERHTDETYSHNDNVTWTKGAHEFRFGFDMARIHLNHWQPELSAGGARGYFNFGGQVTALNGGAPASQYNAYAQFLLGISDDEQKGYQYILMTGREWQFGLYAKDRWQVTRKLTIDYGLRYELFPLMTRSDGKGLEALDPYTNTLYLGGRGTTPEDVNMTVSHKLFAPRIGLAYRLDDKTVIRAGYGLNYDPLAWSRPLRGFYPLTINYNYPNNTTFSAAATPSGGTLAGGIPDATASLALLTSQLNTGVLQLPGNVTERSPWNGPLHRGYVQSWNFTIERKLPSDIIASVAYVGQHSVHLMADDNINSEAPGGGVAGLPYDKLFGRSVATSMWDGYLSSSFNSLQVAANKSFSKGLLVKAAYTWSKAIDYTDDDGWASVSYNYAPTFQRNRALAGFDRAQNLELSWVYDLPLGTGRAFLNQGVIAKIVGGWQTAGIMACYTGTPLTVGANDNLNDGGSGLQTANQIAALQFVGTPGTNGYWYNPSSFASPANATFGNTGRNYIRGPGTWNTDININRTFAIKERLKLTFKAEAYNMPNTSHFNAPDVNVNDAAFMKITSSYGERNIRFNLRMQW